MVEFTLSADVPTYGLPVNYADVTLGLDAISAFRTVLASHSETLVIDGVAVDRIAKHESPSGQIIGIGRSQALVDFIPKTTNGEIIDTSDGYVTLRLTGVRAQDVIGLLTPVDLRRDVTQNGQVFRTMLGHLAAIIVVIEDGFDLIVGSSFAQFAVHEVVSSMKSVAAIARHKER